ncbi:hypothetical protein RintRC_7394 [Richelia intracellularis]|nr:hypothetical protein RintRC_7394 [Richelia intracellularis]
MSGLPAATEKVFNILVGELNTIPYIIMVLIYVASSNHTF